jgi:hypothetical protein
VAASSPFSYMFDSEEPSTEPLPYNPPIAVNRTCPARSKKA